MLTVLTSGKAAPGVTTSTWALGLCWPRPVLIADCDPAGGDMAAGLLAGRVSTEHGLLSWSTSVRRGLPAMEAAGALAEHVVQVPENGWAWFLPGFSNATQGRSFGEDTWERLGLALQRCAAALGRDVLVDTGRLAGGRGTGPVLRAADRVLLTVRPTVRSVHAAQDALLRVQHELGDLDRVTALVVGPGPYSAGEVGAALQLRVAARLPDDRVSAAMLSDGGAGSVTRPLGRAPLFRSASGLIRQLMGGAQELAGQVTA